MTKRFIISLISAVVLLFMVPVSSLGATPSLGLIGPGTITANVNSGTITNYPLNVANIEQSATVSVAGLGQQNSGIPYAVTPTQDFSPYTARSWVSVNRSILEPLTPGQSQPVVVTIDTRSVSPGEYYAAVLIQSGTGVIQSILVPIFVTVDSNLINITRSGTIASLDVSGPYGAATSGDPITFTANFINTGNCKIEGANLKVVVRDAGGNSIWESSTPISSWGVTYVLPNYGRNVTAIKQDGFAVNITTAYSVTASISLSDETVVSQMTVGFSVNYTLPGDVNGDGVVNVLDLIIVGNNIGQTGTPGWIPADVVKDGIVNVLDLIFVGNQIGKV
jgi:hypothetical protein